MAVSQWLFLSGSLFNGNLLMTESHVVPMAVLIVFLNGCFSMAVYQSQFLMFLCEWQFFNGCFLENDPFKDNSFERITTTNTLYFWPQPTDNVKELLRVLKPTGKLLIAYRSKSCMDQLELAKHGFEKYENQDVEKLLHGAGFKAISTQTIKEPELEFDGKTFQMEGIFTTAIK